MCKDKDGENWKTLTQFDRQLMVEIVNFLSVNNSSVYDDVDDF